MHLKALKLHGFKSFADPSTLRFEPGVTAVVGPNGCGKSNIADAIRWVLGEQSAKALRGGKMQDVIFEGADTRKPSQMCEVSLLLTDCEKQLGSEFHEIEIMRRVYRDGQSEYFFNGQPCRLKDIHKLFMDTGIGRTSYSIMAQGQIDQILSSKPEERRAVFEEAAGITKYKSQRREALQKLALTDTNLARVADVIGEVGRQIGSLRRQASKALRYKKLSYRLRHLALAYSGYHYSQISTQLATLEEQVIKLRAAAETRRIHFGQRQTELEEKKALRSRLNQRVQDAQQAVFDLRSEKEQMENAANLAQIKRTGLSDRLESSRDNLGETEMQLRELSEQVDSGAQDKQQQLNLLGGSDAIFQNRNRELAVVEGELSKLEQDLQQGKFQLLTLESSVARLRTDSSGYEVDQKTSAHRHDSLLQEVEGVRQQQSSVAQQLSEFEARVEEAMMAKARAHQESTEAQQAITDLTREFRDAQKKLQDIDRQLAQRTARLKLLQQLHEKWEGFGEGAKAILQGRFDATLGGERPAPITKGLEVKPEFGKALEALLGSAVEAITVADLPTAQKILGQLESEQVGSVCLQIAELGAGNANGGELPAGLMPAGAIVNAFEAGAHPAASLLSACYIADDLNAFLEFWKANPAFSFLAVATRKGEIVDRRGLVFGGFSKKPANSIVQREIDLRETGKALVDDQKAHDDQKAFIDGISARLAEAEATLEAKREEVLTATQEVASVQAEQRNAQRSLEEVSNRLKRMESEVSSVENARHEAHSRWEKAQGQLAEAEAAVAQGRERIQQLETRIVEVRTDRDVKRDTLGQARLELAEFRQKVEVLDRGIADMQRRRSQLSELLVQRQQEIEVWTEQVGELEREADAKRARAAQLSESLVVAQQQVEQVRVELTEVEREIGGVENTQDSLRTEAESSQSEFSRCEIKLAESRARAEFLKEDVSREFQTDISTLDWKLLMWRSEDDPPDLKSLDLDDDEDEAEAGNQKPEAREQKPVVEAAPVEATSVAQAADGGAEASVSGDAPVQTEAATADAGPVKRRRKPKQKGEPNEDDLAALEKTSWDQVKADVEAIRQRIAGMGAVNLVAIEEYAELKQRYDFLKSQNDDLTTSKAELLKAIDEINETSQKQFAITFEQIKKNFEYTFTTLFGGGRAGLELIATDDPLESGIEITAQPPGTKLKSITLLSGGQKTLTAVGLLFALYMVKPSPFCLLDELDAPLDESNIGRFTDLLKKFVHESQFIIITHNKRTVAAASAIYGVTMEERGVSKTVSMRFNQDKGEPEAQQMNIAEAVRGAKGRSSKAAADERAAEAPKGAVVATVSSTAVATADEEPAPESAS
ncbi:chromosome segregation protein SMC [Nibricoccus aquaticus]|uniref:Chromosome partition protein Smc n=1 Tax=Nibricoccus aquaticus TaxID=2576891 RepID=A0A290QA96_9BACT|nr:chromosome segregation protein SMC [Nibricoccus aquaticus]ATC65343.1 chromosome segregation protein SMC [Nibricoccus aquaticus]